MVAVRITQSAQDGSASFYTKSYHIDGDTTIVMSYLATFHRGLDIKFGMSCNPLYSFFIAIIHGDKDKD